MGEHLRCERFVDLPKLDVVITEIVARKQLWNRVRRRHQQALGPQVDRVYLPIDELHPRRRGRKPSDAGVRSDPDACGAIREWRGITGCDAAQSTRAIEG